MSSHMHSLDTGAHTQPHAYTQLSRGEPHPSELLLFLLSCLVLPSRLLASKVRLGRANETSSLADAHAGGHVPNPPDKTHETNTHRSEPTPRGWGGSRTESPPSPGFSVLDCSIRPLSAIIFFAEEDSAPGNWAPDEPLLSLPCTAGRASAEGSCVSSGNRMRLLIFIELQEPFFFYFPAN